MLPPPVLPFSLVITQAKFRTLPCPGQQRVLPEPAVGHFRSVSLGVSLSPGEAVFGVWPIPVACWSLSQKAFPEAWAATLTGPDLSEGRGTGHRQTRLLRLGGVSFLYMFCLSVCIFFSHEPVSEGTVFLVSMHRVEQGRPHLWEGSWFRYF